MDIIGWNTKKMDFPRYGKSLSVLLLRQLDVSPMKNSNCFYFEKAANSVFKHMEFFLSTGRT